MAQDGSCFYLKLRCSDAEMRMRLPPAKLLLKDKTRKEAEQTVRRFQYIFEALDQYVTGKPAPYGLPADLHQYVEEMPGIFNWALKGVPGFINWPQNN